jgi:hypothetical protein
MVLNALQFCLLLFLSCKTIFVAFCRSTRLHAIKVFSCSSAYLKGLLTSLLSATSLYHPLFYFALMNYSNSTDSQSNDWNAAPCSYTSQPPSQSQPTTSSTWEDSFLQFNQSLAAYPSAYAGPSMPSYVHISDPPVLASSPPLQPSESYALTSQPLAHQNHTNSLANDSGGSVAASSRVLADSTMSVVNDSTRKRKEPDHGLTTVTGIENQVEKPPKKKRKKPSAKKTSAQANGLIIEAPAACGAGPPGIPLEATEPVPPLPIPLGALISFVTSA